MFFRYVMTRRRIEDALARALAQTTCPPTPPRLVQAMRHAVFPGGSRSRSILCIAVANACGGKHPRLADACATAIELLHCASLVYDDLPSFDDASIRRGQSAVHVEYGESTAILTAAALTVLSFESVVRASSEAPSLLPKLLLVIASGAGCPSGIVAGQAWESEVDIDLATYHRAKTGAMFESAILSGAIAGGGVLERWVGVGYCIGEAYQIADDLRDTHGRAEEVGKPVGQDAARGRPSASAALGVAGCVSRISALIDEACERLPDCPAPDVIRTAIRRLEFHLLSHSQLTDMRSAWRLG